jgi:hypothetical protein
MGDQRRPWLRLTGALVLALTACDTFFELDLVVTDCVTGLPLKGVTVATHLGDEFSDQDHREETDAAGKVFITLNAPDETTVTLTLTKAGYQTWTKQFEAEPPKPYSICLEPAPP